MRPITASALPLRPASRPVTAPRPGVPAAVSSRPLIAVAQVPTVKARDEVVPSHFTDPQDYKNYVLKLSGYVQNAQAGLADRQGVQKTARAELDAATAKFRGVLDTASKAQAAVQAKDRAVIDRALSAAEAARQAQDDALHPGNREAAALEAQANDDQNQIQGIESQIASLRGQIDYLQPGSGGYAYESQSLNDQISSLMSRENRLEQERLDLSARATEAGSRQRPSDDPQVVATSKRLAAALADLQGARDAMDHDLAPYMTTVDGAQHDLDGHLAPFRAKLNDATDAVKLAQSAVDTQVSRFDDLNHKIGFFQGLNWKLFHGFNAGNFWKDQATRLGVS